MRPFTRPTSIIMKPKTKTKSRIKITFISNVFPSSSLILVIIIVVSLHNTPAYGQGPLDAKYLLQLKQSMVDESKALDSWNPGKPPCFSNKSNWAGIICSRGGRVYGIRLENMGLSGKIDVEALLGLPRLRTISFMYNNFGGPLPEINKLKALRVLYLSYNRFQGKIDFNAFAGMNRLKKVHLAYNQFTGEIPDSLVKLKKLVELRLEGNRFEGAIPDFKQASFKQLNLSNNQLEGPIPESLAKIDPSTFAGNKALCGAPLAPCTGLPNIRQPAPDSPEHHSASKKSMTIIPIIVVAVVVVAVALVVILMIIKKKAAQNESGEPQVPPAVPKQVAAGRDMDQSDEGSCRSTGSTRNRSDTGKLCFLKEDTEKFDLPDLLKASAEILGSGCFGSSYKANLMSGSMVVVKRFKQMNNEGKEDFQEHMRRLGRLEHPNLLSVVAYYYRKEEKLLVSDFVEKGSLAVHLHGNHLRGQPTLDWATRLKVVKGVARGLAYLYQELPSLIAPHGHLKSSNVLLNESFEPMLNDYGLIPLINQESAQDLMVAYKSPEYIANGRINKKTDVWSLGILIIETITGEFPASFLQRGTDQVDLTKWVSTIVGEEGEAGKVFDKNMCTNGINNSEGEIRKLLKIGLACCESDVEKRMDIKEACERMEEVRERDNEDDFYSSYASEADSRSSRGLSEDFTVIVN